MSKHQVVVGVIAALATTSCASSLKVYDGEGRMAKGVPFRAAELFLKSGEHNRHSEGGACAPTPFVEPVALPTGQQYFINVEPAQLAKTGLAVKFSANGAMSEVTLNTEPAGADTIEAVSGALSSLLPFVGNTAAKPETVEPPTALKACDAGEAKVSFTRFSPSP